MIFVCLGSQQYPFNRPLKEIDRLIDENIIKEDVFAQIGNSDYIPKKFKYKDFLNPEDYKKVLEMADVVISHGGTGSIINAIKLSKPTIVIPRQSKYCEHLDDHQFQIVEKFFDMGYVLKAIEMDEIKDMYLKIKAGFKPREFKNSGKIIKMIDDFIMKN